MTHNIALIPGDGIGPEVIHAARQVLEATGVDLEWIITHGPDQPTHRLDAMAVDDLLDQVRASDAALKGPTQSPPDDQGKRSLHVVVRQELDLYANMRPAKTIVGIPGGIPGLDLVLFRENTEDVYSGLEETMADGARAEARKVITKRASERIVRKAFDYASNNERTTVTAVHKADLLKQTDGLFASVARTVAATYPHIRFEERYVDNIVVELVRRPRDQDVLVTPNQYGDILSGVSAGLIGGLGMAPGMNVGDRYAVFEPTHGIALRHAGADRVNPSAAILSGALLLRHLGEETAAQAIEDAVAEVIRAGQQITYDLRIESDGKLAATTSQMTDAIVTQIENILSEDTPWTEARASL